MVVKGRYKTKIRAYGWYCWKCGEHRLIDDVTLVKAKKSRYLGVLCSRCGTELLNCFVVKNHIPDINCDDCEEKFQCYTSADSTVVKPMTSVEFRTVNTLNTANETIEKILKESGVTSYTGMRYDKLDYGEYCTHPHRDDCNHSWMRINYNGPRYSRCEHMMYDKDNQMWICHYGAIKRSMK